MSSWRDSGPRLVERRPAPQPSDRMTRFDWLVLVVMAALNVGLLVYRVVW